MQGDKRSDPLSAAPTPQADAASESEDVDLYDFELPDIRGDLEDIKSILKLHDTTKDKLVFTIFTLNTILTGFTAGYIPQYFYIVHTIKAVLLLSYRWYSYKKLKWHYFMFDFCYFTNFLALIYFWIPISSPIIRGTLFTIVFAYANGPILTAIALWRNSFVPHSNDKMTSLFIHISPAVSVWGIKWHSTVEQGFPLCTSPTHYGPGGCSDVGLWDFMVYPLLFFLLWELLYYAVIEVFRKKRIEERNYATSVQYLAERAKKDFLSKVFNVFGPKYRRQMYFVWHFIYSVISLPLAYLCYLSAEFTIFFSLLLLTVASYNGATFYIDVFSQRYYYEKVLNVKPVKSNQE